MNMLNHTWRFHGGIHFDDKKRFSNAKAAKNAPLLQRYVLPLRQSIGAGSKLLVAKGDKVLKGQKIAEHDGFVSIPLHAPTSGTIGELREIPSANGSYIPAIEILSDGLDQWCDLPPCWENWSEIEEKDLKQRIWNSGIAGMGGAAFPTHVKLTPPLEKAIDTLIVNGGECEPYLTSDHRLMLECAEKVLCGAAIAAKILKVNRILLGVESNKMDAVKELGKHVAKYQVRIVPLPKKYPQGGEKQLIRSLTGRQIISGGLPMDVGCVVQNVGTCAAICDAVTLARPMIERYVTVSGEAVAEPQTWIMRIGTPIQDALRISGGLKENVREVLTGGPMMGFAQNNLDGSVLKSTSGLLFLPKSVIGRDYESSPCIHCGRCVNVCPMRLQPGLLSLMIENQDYEAAAQTNVTDCIECGSCAYVCPARRPLVQFFRRAKQEIKMKRDYKNIAK